MTRISVKCANGTRLIVTRQNYIGNPTSDEMKADAEKLAKFLFDASSCNFSLYFEKAYLDLKHNSW